MFLIGMISFTALATTPVTDQNKKTEFVELHNALTFEVNVVECTMPSITFEATKIHGINAICSQELTKSSNYYSVPADVGWCRLLTNSNMPLHKKLSIPLDVGWDKQIFNSNMQLPKTPLDPIDISWPIRVNIYKVSKIPIQANF